MKSDIKIGVVIPCYKVREHIGRVLQSIPSEVDQIYVVDDACPEKTGQFVRETITDRRVKVIVHPDNQGVGGATISGYQAALQDDMGIVVKIDGDGQMDPRLLSIFIKPLLDAQADYTKGNRFHAFEYLTGMPIPRLIGNSLLSFITKVSSGYWNLMDPANGYTAIHRKVLQLLPLNKIDKGYFFESDMLFRLNIVRALVVDVPLTARYGEEKSNMDLIRVCFEFPMKHFRNAVKRFAYSYLLRDFNIGTLGFVFGWASIIFGAIFGIVKWHGSFVYNRPTAVGTVMFSVLPIIIGVQLVISAIDFDILNTPKTCLHPRL